MIEYLETELLSSLKDAKSVLIAVALMKDYGFNLIEATLPEGCKRKYLVGIDLPTPPSILQTMLELQKINHTEFSARVYYTTETYHPKVYIIENKSGLLTAFLGSANATKGGFSHNIEMNVKITNQPDCLKLQDWFNRLFKSAKQYDVAFIKEYEITYKRNRALASTQKSNRDKVGQNSNPAPFPVVKEGQYFRQSDFDAFVEPTHFETSQEAIALRRVVRNRMIELGERLMESFSENGITNLHFPYRRNNYTSQHYHSRGNNDTAKEAIWLHFGKSPNELSRYPHQNSFVDHIRIQVILMNSIRDAYIGIWLYISKRNRSYYDRKHLNDNLGNPDFVARLFEYIMDLGGSYWISLEYEELYVSDLENSTQLVEFLSQDDFHPEFIIGRNYQPNDSDLSEENIDETVLLEFSKLYKIYDLIKAPSSMPNT